MVSLLDLRVWQIFETGSFRNVPDSKMKSEVTESCVYYSF